jgi:hypothetical protein
MIIDITDTLTILGFLWFVHFAALAFARMTQVFRSPSGGG